jgi:hypothetical protein
VDAHEKSFRKKWAALATVSTAALAIDLKSEFFVKTAQIGELARLDGTGVNDPEAARVPSAGGNAVLTVLQLRRQRVSATSLKAMTSGFSSLPFMPWMVW